MITILLSWMVYLTEKWLKYSNDPSVLSVMMTIQHIQYLLFCGGCESIVMPGLGRTLIDWYPQEKDRYGISYGLSEEQLDWAKNTSHKVLPHIINEHEYSNIKILKCLEEISAHFKLV
ncbi:hypothetical protein [Erwinia aphidicola]|uniref:hypothetical protein n=1 Tax=Erwinia aphidicola TaxID=68334 RepID=UPI0030D5F4A6